MVLSTLKGGTANGHADASFQRSEFQVAQTIRGDIGAASPTTRASAQRYLGEAPCLSCQLRAATCSSKMVYHVIV